MCTARLHSLGQGNRVHHLLYASLSKALSSSSSIRELQKVHSLIITSGLDRSIFFSGKLVSKYSQLKDPFAALAVFHGMSPTENVYQWNTIIRAMTHNGLFSKALEIYAQMVKSNVRPDTYTFPSVINACANLSDVEMGRSCHDHMMEMGFGSDLYICNALIDMYCRFKELDRARNVFEGMPDKDVVSWNSLISGYSSNGYWEEALEIFQQSRVVDVMPDSFTMSGVLIACGGSVAVEEGQIVHGLVEKMGISMDVTVSNGMLSMYFKFDKLADCQKVFDRMTVRDEITWNMIVCGYSNAGLYEESIKLYTKMASEFKPDLLTITSVLRACTHLGNLKLGSYIHEYMTSNGYECDDVTANNIIINMYAKCGDLLASRQVFDNLKKRDLVSWNSIIDGYIENKYYGEAVRLLRMMRMELRPDYVTCVLFLSLSSQLAIVGLARELHCGIIKSGYDSMQVVGNALVDAYAKCGNMEDSMKQFEKMKTHDIVTWNSIIAACCRLGYCNLGLEMIRKMAVKRMVPNIATMLASLPLCTMFAAKCQGKELHGSIFRTGLELDVAIGNALIEMYSKCGSLKYSDQVFEGMRRKDVVTWTALISAYGMYGEGRRAMYAFQEMKISGITPDHIAFVAIIFACSHAGLVQEGQDYFDQMKKVYNIEPRFEHYACMVDLLSRSGQLVEAENFILSMPMKPDASVWGALLSACRVSRDIEIAERVSSHIIELNSDDSGYYVLVSNVYATLGKWEKVRMIRKYLKDRALRKDPGLSWVEIQNRVYLFGTGDKFFEQYEEVNKLLKIFAGLMAKEGYIANLRFVLHVVEKGEKEEMLCQHSERLAIAFGLLNTKPGTPLQIMKNLRVCGDCHTVIKYISKIVHRELLVRDANRFHLFKDGTCSCGDYW